MPILNDKFLFVHIPKTGGQSLESTYKCMIPSELFGHDRDLELAHLGVPKIIEIIGIERFKLYNSFSIVRHPINKLISEYKYKKMGDTRFIGNLPTFDDFITELGKKFNEIYDHKQVEICHYTPQHEFIYEGNKLLVDKIFKFENYHEVLNYLGLKKVIHINKSSEENIVPSSKSVEIIKKLYKKDFELLGYI